jgi:hypothetical protein
MMTPLDVARLDFELHANVLERALGRGGAERDLDVAREHLPAVASALQRVAALLLEHADVA